MSAQYKNISASGAVKATAGVLHGIIVNSHTSGTLRLNDGASGTTSAGVKASGTLTITSTISDGETVLVGDKTYTFVDALSGAANEVLIGASDAIALDNLKSAINGSAGEGTTYGTGTAANPNVTATDNADTTQKVEARDIGTDGNSIATTETMANGSWGGATLASGAEASFLIVNTFTFATGSGVYMLPPGLSFTAGLYATVGGTLDCTLIYQ